jgi:long-chain fatty acid transport protein
MKKVCVSVLVCVGLLMGAFPASASNYGDSFGYSTRGMSLGGAMSARVDDWSSVYYNMAGLGKAQGLDKKNQIAAAYQGNLPMVDIDISRSGVNGDEDLETGTLVFGLALDANVLMHVPSFISSARIGVGLCINDDMTAIKINDLDPRTHTFMRYGREAQRLEVLSGVGLGFMDDLFGIGVGVNSAFAGDGQVVLEEIQLDTDPQSPRGQSKMDMELEPNLLFGLYVSPGKIIEALEGLDFGLTYRDETIQNIDPFQTLGVTDVGQIPLNMLLALTDYFQPRMLVLGMAWKNENLTVSFDLEYQEWSNFHLSRPNMQHYGNDLKKFDDILIPRLGVEYRKNSRTSLLFGYYYQPSFVPDEAVSGVMNFLDNDKHVASCGLVYDITPYVPLKGQTELCLGYQLQYLVERDVDKAAPEPLNPEYSYSGTCHTLMVELNINL